MTAPGQRHTEPHFDHNPGWCVGQHPGHTGRHRSRPVEVEGQVGGVSAWLVEHDAVNVPYVAVNAHLATGITVDLSLDDAVELRDKLGELLRQAGR